MGVGGQHPLGGQMTPQDWPGGFFVGDDRHIGGVALVAGTAVAQIVDARHQAASSTKTSGRTSSRGRSSDCTASISPTEGSDPPPPPAGPFTCMARTSKPTEIGRAHV